MSSIDPEPGRRPRSTSSPLASTAVASRCASLTSRSTDHRSFVTAPTSSTGWPRTAPGSRRCWPTTDSASAAPSRTCGSRRDAARCRRRHAGAARRRPRLPGHHRRPGGRPEAEPRLPPRRPGHGARHAGPGAARRPGDPPQRSHGLRLRRQHRRPRGRRAVDPGEPHRPDLAPRTGAVQPAQDAPRGAHRRTVRVEPGRSPSARSRRRAPLPAARWRGSRPPRPVRSSMPATGGEARLALALALVLLGAGIVTWRLRPR